MTNKSRTSLGGRNFMFSVLGRIVGMICTFVGRGIFVKTLRAEYLGLGGYFGNIFSIISLCELGMGAAISQSLYKPLADRDCSKLSAIMSFFIKVNNIVATVMLILSFIAVPVLPLMTKSSIDVKEIYAAYILFSLHTAASYMLSPKKSLVICDQKLYIVTVANSIVSVLSLIFQSMVLVCSGNYIAYLTVRIFLLTVRDIALNMYADRIYPFLSIKLKPQKEYYKKIYENVKALLFHKIGGTFCRSTDSLLLSAYVGLEGLGKYSNYALVIGTVGAFFDVAINAVTAGVGNLGAVDRGEKSEKVLRKMYFLNFFLLTVGLCVMVSTINPFVKLWLGEDMVFTTSQMAVIASCFYFSCIRDPVQIFLHTYGIFKETRFIPMARAVVNFVLSVIFVQNMGLTGVFLGTVISTVTVPLYFEVNALFKYGFCGRSKEGFLKEMFGYIATSHILSSFCFVMTRKIPETPKGVAGKALISLLISFSVLFFMYSKSEYFAYCKGILLRLAGIDRMRKETVFKANKNNKKV